MIEATQNAIVESERAILRSDETLLGYGALRHPQ
jgi:hypothetical protein